MLGEQVVLLSCHAGLEWSLCGEDVAALSCASQQIHCRGQAVSMASKDFWHRKRIGQMVLALLYLAFGCQKILTRIHGLLPNVWLMHYQGMLFSACLWEQTWLYTSQHRKIWSPAPESVAEASMSLTKPEYLLSWSLADLPISLTLSPQASPSQAHQQPFSRKLPQGRHMLPKYVNLHFTA